MFVLQNDFGDFVLSSGSNLFVLETVVNHFACIAAIQTAIAALGLIGISESSIVIQKVPIDRNLVDASVVESIANAVGMPAIVIAPLKEKGKREVWSNLRDEIWYGVLVIVVAQDNQESTLQLNLTQYLDWIHRIEQLCSHTRFSDVENVVVADLNDTIAEQVDLGNVRAWKAGLYASAVAVWCQCLEQRGFAAATA